MDFDLAQVRAFVAVVRHRHFGRAANELVMTQQAVSKRVRQLERILGQGLLVRHGGGVELTEAGARFLPHARRLLEEAYAAQAAVRPDRDRSLRVDAYGPGMFSLLIANLPDLGLAFSMRRGMDAAVDALLRREIDAAFGRVHDLRRGGLPGALTHRVILLERTVAAVSSSTHPLAGASSLTARDLSEYGLRLPAAQDMPNELLRFFTSYARHVGAALQTTDRLAGFPLDHVLDLVRGEPSRIVLWRYPDRPPDDSDIRLIRLEPTPCYPWSLVWRRDERHPALRTLLEELSAVAGRHGWLDFNPGPDWLPDSDGALLPRDPAGPPGQPPCDLGAGAGG